MRLLLHAVAKDFITDRRKFQALAGVSLDVREGEFFGIIGPTGCGKTTLLHIIAGMEKPTAGTVEFIGEKRTRALVSMVFQDPSLMPWRTVERNIPLGPEYRRDPAPVYRRVTRFFLDMVRLLDFSSAHPAELSGGMRQKAALARALANDPEVILMDEPFANLDAQARLLLREEVVNIWEKERKTIILVTHNIDEAVMLCDRVAVMSASPGVVKNVIPIRLGRPRTLATMSDPEFVARVQQIWDLLRREVEQAMATRGPSGKHPAPTEARKNYFDG
jgi:NitT/TauT family transport system ATP-binding protein